ncbi:MAG TPA: MarR family transcriptional regulator [Labilithrix sp.]|nr:MarR family transcriptional regulator [Labilithrix sp.]
MEVSEAEYQALAEIRFRIRRFLNFSEASARAVGLEPQQHQLLLAVRGLPHDAAPTVKRIAERLQVQHNSAVELVRRSVENGLVSKRPNTEDRREVLLAITPKGERVLAKLALAHRTELRSMAPTLLDAVETLLGDRPSRRRKETA